jgi:hypothetical protein
MPSTRRIIQVGCALVLGLLLLVAIEAAARRFPGVMPVQWQIMSFFVNYPFTVAADDELGFSMPPNQHEVIRTHDYTFLAETDSNGYPNRDPWPTNPALVFLGDSLIIGVGVGLDGSFRGLLARMRPDQSVLNLGLAGAGPERQSRIYRRFSARWRPSLVVACLFLASDFENDFQFRSWLRDGRGQDYNAFRLMLARTARDKGLLQRVLDNSWLLDSLPQVVFHPFQHEGRVENRYRFPDGTEILFERHALEFAATPAAPDDPRLQPFLQSIIKLRDLAESGDAKFLVMLIPSKEELFGVPPSAAQENLAARTKQRLATMQLAVLDLYPALEQRGARQAPFYSQDIHLNALGNRIVAEELAGWLNRNLRNVN